jgi:hypothetical protein
VVVMGGRTMAVDLMGLDGGGAMLDFGTGRGREAGREAGREVVGGSRSGIGDGRWAAVGFWMKLGMARD